MITEFQPSDDFRVNPVQEHEQDHPRTVQLEDGRFLIMWRTGWGGWISGQIFERDGTRVGAEFRISEWSVHPMGDIAVAPLPGGGFAVSWSGRSVDESNNSDLILQIFDAAGDRQGAAIVVTHGGVSTQHSPALALLASGNFVLTWNHLTTTGTQITGVDVKAQIFTPTGARVGSEFVVNIATLDSQQSSTVTALAEGGFVVAWHDNSRSNPYGDTGFTAAQVFTDTGARVGSEFRVNTVAHNDQRGATIAALSNGGFVVTWTDTSTGSTFQGGFPAKFQLFTAAGAKIGGEVIIDTSGTSTSDSVRVAELAGGGFIVSWVDEVWSGGLLLSSQDFGQVYDEAGQPVGGRLTLSAATPYHWDPSVESLADGSFVLSYQKSESGGSFERDVHARLFTALRDGETLHGTGAGETLGGGDLDDFLGGYGGNDVLAGGAGEDMLDGGTGDDQIDGGADADRLTGGAGNDQLDGGTGADIVDGGAGGDQLDGGDDADRLIGGAGNDRLDGGTGADRMVGGVGDDVYIVDDAGDVVVEAAGQGTDELRTALASYVIPAGVERLTGISSEGQTLTGGSAADTITGGGGDDALNGLGGDDLLDGGAGADTMTGGAGNDTYLIDSADSVVEAAGGGTDEIRTAAASYTLATANVENLRGLSDAGQALTGDEGNNRIEGAAGADLLDGAGGADTLIGGAGGDVLAGGVGNDILNGGADADSLAGGEGNDSLDGSAGSDSLAGGDGDDVLKFSAAAGSGDVDTLDGGSGFDVLVASFGAATHPAGLRYSIVQGGDGSYSGWYAQGSERVEFSGIEAFQITGSAHADRLLGGALADYLIGGAGNDLIEGGDGNDLIVGAEGSDTLVGGAGDDRYVVSDGGDTIVEQENGGIDQVDASTAAYTLGANIENLAGTGSGAQTLAGNGLANRIVALGGASLLQGAGGDDILEGGDSGDTLDGGAGADTMRGGNGDDIYLVDAADDLVVDSGGWSDEIRTSLADYTLTSASGVENLTGLATTGQTLTGTAARNTLTGGSGDDRLLGMGGSDILMGGAGADYLDDGIYAGYMFGGAGDDTYVVDYAGEYIFEGAGEGTDRVLTNLSSYVLPNHVELLTGTVDTGQDLRGNAANNVITGGGGNDIIRLQDAGTDSAFGNGGDDSIFFGGALTSTDRVDGGDGSDLLTLQGPGINLTFAPTTVVNVETLSVLSHKDSRFGSGSATPFHYRLVSSDATVAAAALLTVDGSGLALGESLTFDGAAETDGRFVLRGGGGNDSLRGGAGADRIEGGAGNDTLKGGAGVDELVGGSGNDLYVLSDATDAVIEAESGGTDEVRTGLASFSIAALANVENLTGSSPSGQALDGNGLANVITGGTGNDVISGGAGADTLRGGAGDDVLVVDDAGDIVDERAGEGTDEIRTGLASFSIAALSNVENLTGLAATGQTLTGNAGANRITGGAGNDVIDGGGGADDMAGGAGNDVYHVDEAGDVVAEAAGEGSDEVRTGLASYSLAGTEIEKLTATSDAAHDFEGNAAANHLTGGAGNDLLRLQGGGEDGAHGGGGNDVLYFGAALSAGDVADGGEGRDAIVLQGNVTAVLSETNLVGIESISIQSGANATFGDTANNFYDYDVTTADGNVASGQQLIVNAQSLRSGEDFTFDGSAETDGKFLVYGGHGVDDLTGGAGADVFLFEGQRWGANDKVDGGAGRDALVISAGSGLTRIEFGADSLANIESISLNNRYATDPSQKPSYELVLHNGNVAAGGTLIVNGSSIPAGQLVNIDGRGVHDGNLILFGGGGHDTLFGGDGNDLILGGGGADGLTGGAGADTFRYDAASDSSGGLHDLIGDFQTGIDKIDLSRIDANTHLDGNQAFSWIGSNAFSGTGAASAGELRVFDDNGYQRIEGDTNGDGVADLVIVLQVGTAPVVQGDFLL
jgi:Ca2+-binding RTX toxin-like protein